MVQYIESWGEGGGGLGGGGGLMNVDTVLKWKKVEGKNTGQLILPKRSKNV